MSVAAIETGQVRIRHIRRRLDAAVGEPGERTWLGVPMVPVWAGLDGETDWINGQLEPRLNEEGAFNVALPNGTGSDGVLHRDRFAVIRDRGAYQPGDEWLEFYEVPPGGRVGELLFVGTPTAAKLTGSTIEIRGFNAELLTKKARETAAGFWHHAPRDVFNAYARGWTAPLAEDFADGDPGWFATAATYVDGTVRLDAGGSLTTPVLNMGDRWRLEARLRVWSAGSVQLLLCQPATAPGFKDISVVLTADPVASTAQLAIGLRSSGSATYITNDAATQAIDPGSVAITIERAGRWLFLYADNTLVNVHPAVDLKNAHQLIVATNNTAYIDSLLMRTAVDVINGPEEDRGDARLPGAPTPGGLIGEYFSDVDLKGKALYADRVLAPTRKPYARRLDPTLPFALVSPPIWQPPGSASGEYFSARWTGSIYLPLEHQDYRLRVTVNDGARVWVGDTRHGHTNIDNWAAGGITIGNWLTSHLGSEKSGWYPIVVEYRQETGAGGIRLDYQRAQDAFSGTWLRAGAALTDSTIQIAKLSPIGCYTADVRRDSHYEQLKALRDTFALQSVVEPRSLEQPGFPGVVVPRVRVGRDTEVVLAEDALEAQTEIDAEGTISTLLVDAQGLGDEQTQITEEAINFAALALHPLVQSEYESLADISVPGLAEQRAQSLLALRSSPWEQVQARPPRRREYADTFPLTGELATMRWAPGDGVRLALPKLGVRDTSPRQILGVTHPISPAGIGKPIASFRQRPRGLDVVLRDILRKTLTASRNYQRQLVTVSGTAGGNTGSSTDAYSRTAAPRNLGDIARAEVVVRSVTSLTVPWTIEVDAGNTGVQVERVGRYDVTAFLVANNGQQHYARLLSGNGSVEITLELLVSV